MTVVRLCLSALPTLVQVDRSASGQVKLSGIVGTVFNSILELLLMRANVTYLDADKQGDIVNERRQMYDGCLGMLQRNESDTFFPMLEYPVMGPGLRHRFPFTTQRSMIVSAYNRSSAEMTTGVLDAFQSFSLDLWLAIAASFALLAVVLASVHTVYQRLPVFRPRIKWFQRNILLTRRSNCCLQRCCKSVVYGAIAKQHSSYHIAHQSSANLILVYALALFAFLTGFFFCSMIKTDMVVIKLPVRRRSLISATLTLKFTVRVNVRSDNNVHVGQYVPVH